VRAVGTLLRFQLRRHRWIFVAPLLLAIAHEVLLLSIYQFWKSQLRISEWLVNLIPEPIREGVGIPITDLTHPRTFQALVYLRPDFRAITLFFGIVVATDVVAGEIGRGTSDLLFAQPIRRAHAIAAAALAILLHVLCLGAAILAGFVIATAIFPMGARQPAWFEIVPCVLDVVASSFAIALLAMCASCACSSRIRAVVASVTVVVLPLVLEFVGVFSPALRRTLAVLPEHYYRPHVLLAGIDRAFPFTDGLALAVIAIASFAGAVWITGRRDLAR